MIKLDYKKQSENTFSRMDIMDRFLVVSKDRGEQIYNGYTQEELVDTLYEQGVTDADVFILGEDNKT